MLNPRWREPAAQAELRAAWKAAGSLRVEQVLEEGLAERLLEALRAQPYQLDLSRDPEGVRYQMWAYRWRAEPDCDHLLCRLGRWLRGPGQAWVEAITGLPFGAPPSDLLLAAAFTKGSYLDRHNDFDGQRGVAYVLGLTPHRWPPEQGGHLELLEAEGDGVLERRPPGWNTLDLLDVRRPDRWHRVPILRDHLERRTVAGWFYPAPSAGRS